METGTISKTTDQRRFIPIHAIANSIGIAVCHSLPAAHALSGCDTVSSFYGIGKKKVWRQLLKMSEADLNLLGTFHEEEAPQSVNTARNFVSTLYDSAKKMKQHHFSLNKLRFKMSVL